MTPKEQRFSRPKAWHSAIGGVLRELLQRKGDDVPTVAAHSYSFSVKMQLGRIVAGKEVAVPIVLDAIDEICTKVYCLSQSRSIADRRTLRQLHELRDTYPTDPALELDKPWSRTKARLAARDAKPGL
jgi:hypothetical protein